MNREFSQRPPLAGQWFDVAVIGGGVNGVAIARECARAGAAVLLAEQHDFASGTTSRSTRIIHGGLRYLEHGEIGLVRESVAERERLLRQRPHLVRSLNFLLAMPPGRGRRSALGIRAGLWLYRRFGDGAPHRGPGDGEARRRFEQALDSGRRLALFSYDDAQCEFPERLVAEWLREAVAAGAEVRNHTRALRIQTSGGRVQGVLLRDQLSGAEFAIECRLVVNAGGPWADQVAAAAGLRQGARLVGGTRGSHIVLGRLPGVSSSAIYAPAADGRPVFMVPWNGQVLVGTTDIPDQGDPGRTLPTTDEIAYLLAAVNAMFPAARLGLADIAYAFAGVRPLPYAPGEAPAAISRRHFLHNHGADGAAGMVSVIGGKLTTAASLARQCARKLGYGVAEPAGAVAMADDGPDAALLEWQRRVASSAGIGKRTAHALVDWHGEHALKLARAAARDARLRAPLCEHTAHIAVEALSAVQDEYAATLADVLLRRVPVALHASWSAACTRTAANSVGAALGWTERRREEEIERFQQERAAFLVKPVPAARALAPETA
ncbi:MAG TPA: glycerol-3-phosphate dehydrogenase/oxidase [Terriglobales bacterium]|nr:glycerol-3-phosphate dehydrogenase/oxidase [Terriglobales bacterium]